MALHLSAKEAARLTGKVKQPTARQQEARSIEKPAEGDIPNTRIENPTHRVKRGLPFENAPPIGSEGICFEEADGIWWFHIARADGGGDALFCLSAATVERCIETI